MSIDTFMSSSVSLHYYLIWLYQIDMINKLFGEVKVIRYTYVLWLNNSHPTLSLIACLNILLVIWDLLT